MPEWLWEGWVLPAFSSCFAISLRRPRFKTTICGWVGSQLLKSHSYQFHIFALHHHARVYLAELFPYYIWHLYAFVNASSRWHHAMSHSWIILESLLNHSWYIVILLLNMLQLPRIHPQPQPSPACPQPGFRHCWLPARRVPRPNSSWWMGPCNTCGLADWSYNGYIIYHYDIYIYVGYLGYLYTYILSYIHLYIYAYIIVIWWRMVCIYIIIINYQFNLYHIQFVMLLYMGVQHFKGRKDDKDELKCYSNIQQYTLNAYFWLPQRTHTHIVFEAITPFRRLPGCWCCTSGAACVGSSIVPPWLESVHSIRHRSTGAAVLARIEAGQKTWL